MLTRLRQGATPLIRALFKFMEYLDWHKLGILTETGSTYFSRMTEEVYIKAKNDSSSIDVIAYWQIQANEKIDHIRSSSKITLLSTRQKTTVDILCSAYEENTVWPEYVWIPHSYLLDDIKGIHTSCSISRALENVIFIRWHIPDSEFNATQTNPYSVTLRNLILISAHKLLI